MKKIMHILFLSCLKASELIEKDFHLRLTFREKLQLRMHKMMCRNCSRYGNQSQLLENGIRNLHKKEALAVDFKKLEERIIQKLNEA